MEAQALPKKNGLGSFGVVKFRSLDMGDVKAFCQPEKVEGLKAFVGKVCAVTVGIKGGRFGDPQFELVSVQ